MRGKVRSDRGPVLSALNMWTMPLPNCGKTAMKMTMMPKPPNQWVRARQRTRLAGRPSMSSMTVAPVPDRPEIHSKMLSRTDK